MIPPVPKTPPATYVQHFSPAVHLRQMRLRGPLKVVFPYESARMKSISHTGPRILTRQELNRLLGSSPNSTAIHVSRPPCTTTFSTGLAEYYYRGNDLRYSENVVIPAAQSIEILEKDKNNNMSTANSSRQNFQAILGQNFQQ